MCTISGICITWVSYNIRKRTLWIWWWLLLHLCQIPRLFTGKDGYFMQKINTTTSRCQNWTKSSKRLSRCLLPVSNMLVILQHHDHCWNCWNHLCRILLFLCLLLLPMSDANVSAKDWKIIDNPHELNFQFWFIAHNSLLSNILMKTVNCRRIVLFKKYTSSKIKNTQFYPWRTIITIIDTEKKLLLHETDVIQMIEFVELGQTHTNILIVT